MKFKRLIDFDYQLQRRLTQIANGYNPACVECLDLDYTLDIDTGEPTVCVPCAWKNMQKLQRTMKGMITDEEEL